MKDKPLNQEWFFYVVRCSDDTLYSGITTNLENRVKKHNQGSGAKYTSGRRPVTLVYSENCADISAARIRESQVKNLSRSQKTHLINGL
ncbi:endonuclease-like protein [Dehalogenimonas sp. WBC-2]|nr:endonuclease-like protein [Dehalogenimonas sp. WBC-2]